MAWAGKRWSSSVRASHSSVYELRITRMVLPE
jgi:hypothetical protein